MKLLAKGETNAIDLLYASTYSAMVVYPTSPSAELVSLLNNHDKFFDVKNCNSYVGYCIGQARKYGVKGSRMGAVKKVLVCLDAYIQAYPSQVNVTSILSKRLMDVCGLLPKDESYCFVKDLKSSNGDMKPYLFLCGAKHDLTISLQEFYNRVKKAYDTYGDRAKLADKNEGIDWKALSHALRALDQMKMLLREGQLFYPLKTAVALKDVKQGNRSWPEVEAMINEGLEEVDQLRESCEAKNVYDQNFVENLVLSFYEH